jgi:hypothetical protein
MRDILLGASLTVKMTYTKIIAEGEIMISLKLCVSACLLAFSPTGSRKLRIVVQKILQIIPGFEDILLQLTDR